MWKIGVVAAISLAIAPAQAGHHRVVSAGVISEMTACVQVGDYLRPYIFPAPDWRPFFVKHMYVGPVITCLPTGAPIVASEQVVSVKY